MTFKITGVDGASLSGDRRVTDEALLYVAILAASDTTIPITLTRKNQRNLVA